MVYRISSAIKAYELVSALNSGIVNYGTYSVRSDDFDTIKFKFKFENGWGANVMVSKFSLGGLQGLWSLSVLDRLDQVSFTTDAAKCVLGMLKPAEVNELLLKINSLDQDGKLPIQDKYKTS